MQNESVMSLNFRTINVTIHQLIKLIDDDSLKMEYLFDKNSIAMTNAQKSQYIESILIRAPLTSLVVWDGKDNYSIIDGMQRIKLLHEFYNDKFTLTDLKFIHEFDGKLYSDLGRPFQRRIEETRIGLEAIDSISNPMMGYRVALSYL